MPMMPLALPPGMAQQGTAYQSAGRWLNARYMRWYERTMRPVGGWIVGTTNGDLDGPGRGVHTWRFFSNSRACAIGTPNKLWYYDGDMRHDITPTTFSPGNLNTAGGTGFGFGDFGAGEFSIDGAGGVSDATSWSLDNFGEYLVGCASHDENIWLWQGDPTVLPTVLDVTAPTARAVFVTPERFIVALGANGNPRQVMWPDLQSTSDWAATEENQAGDLQLQTGGALLAGCAVRQQSLLLTTIDAWTMTYVGPEVVYSFSQVGFDCGLIGGNALVPFLGGAGWMSYNGFYTFNGGVVTPISNCEVADEIFRDIDRAQQSKCHGGHNSQYGELTWWYPSLSTGDMRSVTWNYRESHWALDGQPARTCWADRGIFDDPLAVSTAGRVYAQENGWLAEGASRVGQVYAESGPVEIGTGDNVYMVRQCYPDELTPGQWALSLATKFTPESTNYSYGPYTLLPKTNMRVTGRQVAVRLTLAADGDARVGQFRFDGIVGGLR